MDETQEKFKKKIEKLQELKKIKQELNIIIENKKLNKINEIKEKFMNKHKLNNRFIELDFLKGIAVILMVIFHYFYLSKILNYKDYNISSGILHQFAEIAHNTFILVSGMNLAISNLRNSNNFKFKKLKRGLFLICIGLIITFLTKFDFPDSYVKFGIFHFLGVATIIGSLYSNYPKVSLFIAAFIFIVNYLLVNKINLFNFCQSNPFLCFISGIMNIKYSSIDHFSLIPYLGLFSLGITLGHIFYKKNKKTNKLERNFKDKYVKVFDNKFSKILSYIGKYSLIIYIIHFVLFYLHFKILLRLRKDKLETKMLFNNI